MSILDQVKAAKQRIQNLSVEDLEAELERGDAILLDVRDIRERWREGSIPGARSVPRGMLEFWADPESPYYRAFLDPARRTILYCAGGMRSALAATALQDLGYRDVAHLEPGFEGWKQAGRKIEPVPVPEEIKNS